LAACPCGYRAFAPRRSSFERGSKVVGELRVLLAALVDDLVEEAARLAIAGTVADGVAVKSWHVSVI
jgi:hypothetical protein